MGGAGTADERTDFDRMRAGLRGWVRRAAGEGGRRLRGIPPPVLFSILCAAAVSPLVALGAGLTSAAAVAGGTVLSSVGGGALSGVVASAFDRVRGRREGREFSAAELEEEIAQEIREVLGAGGASGQLLRGEVAALLAEIDAGGTVLRAALEIENHDLRYDLIAAVEMLGIDFAEMAFLIKSIAQTAAELQKGLDEQSARGRLIIEQNDRQSAEIRLVREDLTLILRRASAVQGEGRGELGPRWVHGCPYRGLLPFREADAEVFYGREALTADLVVKVATQLARGGPLVVTGASGAGKSSLVRAGLLPTLARGVQIEGSENWPRRVITPNNDPLTELATHLAALGGSDVVAVRDSLARRPLQAHLEVRRALLAGASRRGPGQLPSADDGTRLVLIVDQFEQVFTLSSGPDAETERRAFITALCAAATNPAPDNVGPPAVVIIAVRGDFCDRCAAYSDLAHALQEAQFIVGVMTESDLRLAINGPADAAGLRIDPALTDTIMSDLRAVRGDDTAGALPLLSQAMALTWEKREGDLLTSHGYGLIGGVSHAVQTGADSVYGSLPAEQQALARRVLLRMTIIGRDGRLARRPVTLLTLYEGHLEVDRSAIDAVLEAFAIQRLVVLDDSIVQIAHDAVLQAWPKLRGWLEEERAGWYLHGQLTDDAAAWHDHDDDSSFLYRGIQLATLEQAVSAWASSPASYPALTTRERDFLDASKRAVVRNTRWRQTVAASLIVLLIASLTAAGLAVAAARNADQQRRNAVSAQLAAQSEQLYATDPVIASMLATAALRIAPTPQARDSILDVLLQPLRGVLGSKGHWPMGLAFSPDGKTLATKGNDGTARLWNMNTHRQIGSPITARRGRVLGVAFSPNSRILATVDSDGTARLWDTRTHHQVGAPITIGGKGHWPMEVAFSSNGQVLATADSGTVRLLDTRTHHQLGASITIPGGSVLGIAFSPDGKVLATTCSDYLARFWDTATHKQIGAPIAGNSNGQRGEGVLGLAFSPNGKTLATADVDGTARLWDTASHRQIGTAMSAQGAAAGGGDAYGVAFSPDGKNLATTDSDGIIQMWNVATHRRIRAPIITDTLLDEVAFSPDGKKVATTEFEGPAKLWDIGIYHQVGGPIGRSVLGMAFRPDDKTLSTVDTDDGTIRSWDVTTHRQIGPPVTIRGATSRAAAISPQSRAAFSPNGKILAITEGRHAIQLWESATGQPIGRLTVKGFILGAGVAFSPDGKTIASGENDGTIRLWNLATHQQLGPAIAVGAPGIVAGGVAFSPDGKTLASISDDGTIRLWDLATHQQLGPAIIAGVGGYSLVFSRDGKILADADHVYNQARLWDVAFPSLNSICSIANRSLTRNQWATYVLTEPYQNICP